MKSKINFTAILFFLLINFSIAQNYKTGIGIRLGGLSNGLSFRHFINDDSAIEGIIGFAHHSTILTCLYEKFKPIEKAEGLKWFYGGGAHLGFWRYGGYYYMYKEHGDHIYVVEEGESRAVFGLDFIIGMDYKFKNAPLNIGLDIKPVFDFYNGVESYFDGAFSFRFVF